jgi:hypothetical protein
MNRIKSLPPEGRDQDPTTFAEILQELLWQEPRATAAVLIDGEGETVDYASSLSAYYTKVVAANLRIVLDDLIRGARTIDQNLRHSLPPDAPPRTSKRPASHPPPSGLSHAMIAARTRSFFVHPLGDGYALVLVLRRRVFTVSSRAVALAVCRLAKEAGWGAPLEETLPWHPAEVETRRGDRFRPLQIKTGEAWQQVEILGSVVGLARERGYRCRLQGGAEITLVRESTGIWFVDQPAPGLRRSRPDF